PLGRESDDGRSEASGSSRPDDPRHRAAGGGRTRTPRQDHPCRGRVRRSSESGARGRDHGAPAHRDSVTLSPDAGADRLGEKYDGRFPFANRYTVIHRALVEPGGRWGWAAWRPTLEAG